jgi:hypothetical protein
MNIANNKEEFGAVTPENEMKVSRPYTTIDDGKRSDIML